MGGAEEGEGCARWRTWEQVWEARTGEGEGAGELFGYLAYGAIAVRPFRLPRVNRDAHIYHSQLAFATLASTLTIYLTSSTSVYSSKDSPSIPHESSTPLSSETTSKYGAVDDSANVAAAEVPVLKQRPRKTLYFVRFLPFVRCPPTYS
jgi:hypothetical protein